jgi:hypothetical protein
MSLEQPLILTARMDEHSFAFFDSLRKLHFPEERNFLRAHLTLFHKLPGRDSAAIANDLDEIGAATEILPLAFTGWRSLGRGVAMNVESTKLTAVRSAFSKRRFGDLTPQDRQGFRPHITVQNKVEPAVATKLLDELVGQGWPSAGQVVGLELWRYLGGPWEPVSFHSFVSRA